MKKKHLASILSLLVAIGIWVTVVFVSPRREIPIVEGLYWGMSPAQAEKVLGGSYETEDLTVTDKTEYRYKAVVFGEEAEITCFFWKGRILSDIYFRWDSNPEAIAGQAYNCLYEYYHDQDGFFLNEGDPVSLGIDYNGPILRYQITKEDTSLTISCIDLR